MSIQSSLKRTFVALSAAVVMSSVAVGAAVGALFKRGLHGVLREVDQDLLDLRGITREGDVRATENFHGQPTFECDHAMNQAGEIGGCERRLGQSRQASRPRRYAHRAPSLVLAPQGT